MDNIVNENLSDDDTSNNLMTTSLPVAPLPKESDLRIPPATGEEYLARVRLEASKNKTVVANIDVKKYEGKRTAQYFNNTVTSDPRADFKPSLEWQTKKCEEFGKVATRAVLEKKNFFKDYPDCKKTTLPKRKSDWYKFCFGRTNATQDVLEPIEDVPDMSLNPNKPLLSYMYNMSQATIVQLLEYQIEWFEEFGYSQEAFEWIYALLCFLEKPLIPETTSSLRSLARKCFELRAKLTDSKAESLNSLNLFISLVGRYFSQLDLVDS